MRHGSTARRAGRQPSGPLSIPVQRRSHRLVGDTHGHAPRPKAMALQVELAVTAGRDPAPYFERNAALNAKAVLSTKAN
eukprot:352986-Chlamydomonas_euryale.AAC.21